jgi:adenosylcobinamide-GDP ribazoletransferase
MSPTKAIKTFRDMLSFFTIIPLGKTEDFVITTAGHIYLFPALGAFIGLLGALYFVGSSLLSYHILYFVILFVQIPIGFFLRVLPALTTLAFLLVLTGLQHLDGLIDLGNALGLGKLEERRAAAHRWTVSYKGALLAIVVEALAFFGLTLMNIQVAFLGIIAAEVAAKLGMVTIAVVGEPTHRGLGSIFLESAKKKRNIIAFLTAILIVYVLLGPTGIGVAFVSMLLGVFMGRVGKSVFGGVSGDMLGATNEVVRAAALILVGSVLL